MNKKIKYSIFTFILFIYNCSLVKAVSLFGNTNKKDVCGLSLPSNVPGFTSGLIDLIKILVPIILIIMGSLDFAKAVMANDEKKMKESRDKFIRRLVVAIFIFWIVAIVQFVFKNVSNDNGYTSCMKCILNNDCADSTEDYGYGKKYCNEYSIYNCPSTDSYGYSCTKSSSTTACRFVCTSISDTKLCEQTSYCELSGISCVEKTVTGSSNKTKKSNKSSDTKTTTTVTSTCLSDCNKKKDKTAKEKCIKSCQDKQTNVSCDSCKQITASTTAQQACLKNCNPSTKSSSKTTKDLCSTRSVSTCTKSKDSNGSTCKVKNGKCTTK